MITRSDSSRKLRDRLKELAITVDVSSTVPITDYYLIAQDLDNVAIIEWEKHRNLEQAYVHLMKLSILLLEKIPSHNSFHRKQYEPEKLWAKRVADKTLKQLERFVAELDRIEDEKIRKRDLELIDEFDRLDGLDDPSSEETSKETTVEPVIIASTKNEDFDQFAIFESKPSLLIPAVEVIAAGTTVAIESSSSSSAVATKVSLTNPSEKARLFNLLKISDPSQNSLAALPSPTISPQPQLPLPKVIPATPEPPEIIPDPIMQVMHIPSVPMLDSQNQMKALTLAPSPIEAEPIEPISTQEVDILIFIGDVLR
jgi:hypothetical protein